MEWVKAHAVGDTRGFVKLVAHSETLRTLGATAVGVNATDIIHIPALAMKAGMRLDDLVLKVLHPWGTGPLAPARIQPPPPTDATGGLSRTAAVG